MISFALDLRSWLSALSAMIMASNGHVLCAGNWTKIDNQGITVSLIFMLVAGYFVFSLQAQVHFKRSRPTPAARNFSLETFPTRKPGMIEKLSEAPGRPDAEPPEANKIAPNFMPSSQLEPGNNFFCSGSLPQFFDGNALGTGLEQRRFATLWYTWYAQATTQVFNLFLFISVTYFQVPSCQPKRSARATHTHVSRSSVVSVQCTLGCLKAVGKRATKMSNLFCRVASNRTEKPWCTFYTTYSQACLSTNQAVASCN